MVPSELDELINPAEVEIFTPDVALDVDFDVDIIFDVDVDLVVVVVVVVDVVVIVDLVVDLGVILDVDVDRVVELDVDLVGTREENPEGDIDVVVDIFDNVELDVTNVVLPLQKLITVRSRKL